MEEIDSPEIPDGSVALVVEWQFLTQRCKGAKMQREKRFLCAFGLNIPLSI